MPLPADDRSSLLPARVRIGLGKRAIAIVAALLLEALLLLVLLSLGQSAGLREESGPTLTTFDAASAPDEAPDSPAPEPQEPKPSARATPRAETPDVQQQPVQVTPAPSPAFIPLPRDRMASADIGSQARKPVAPAPTAQPAYGPPDTGTAGPPDTARVGTAPNGEPLYAAAWYRKPYDDELRGYLSTATGPGWGLIACRTAPNWRVEDCVALGESPLGSNIARSVLAAAWQFKVRPPRVGGRSMVGAWVRIRIDYDLLRP